MIEICLLGSGGVMPLPNRSLTSLFVRYNGKAILVDCGEGTQIALRREKLKYSQIDVILITHLHADHVCGMTGLLLTLGLEGRTEPLKIYGPQGLKEVIDSFRVVAPCLPYQLICEEFNADVLEFNEIELKISAFKLQHSVECYGYRFKLERLPKFDANKAKELDIPIEYWKTLQKGKNVDGYLAKNVLGEKRNGISVLYATDTRPIESIEKYGQNVNLMVLEGMYDDDLYQEKAESTFHLTMEEAVSIAKNSKAKELWLTHLSPSIIEPVKNEEKLKKVFEQTTIGYDGLFKTLTF